MAEEQHQVDGGAPAVVAPALSREEAKDKLRPAVRKMPRVVAENLFMDPEFQGVMNWWMIRTHIFWGVSLAVTFIGLNYTLIWLTAAFDLQPWVVAATFMPLGLGYLLWQWRKFQRPKTTEKN